MTAIGLLRCRVWWTYNSFDINLGVDVSLRDIVVETGLLCYNVPMQLLSRMGMKRQVIRFVLIVYA